MLIFGAGVITGGLLVRQVMRRAGPVIQRSANPRPAQALSPGNMRLEFLRRAQRELDLNADQRARIDEILKSSQERSRKLMEPVAPRLREELQKTREEFREVLTPRQRKQFDAIWKQQQKPRDQREPRAPAKERPAPRALPEQEQAEPAARS